MVIVRLVKRRLNCCLFGCWVLVCDRKAFDEVFWRGFLEEGDRNVFWDFILVKPRVGHYLLDPQSFAFVFHQDALDEVFRVLRESVVLREAVFDGSNVFVQLFQRLCIGAERTGAQQKKVDDHAEGPHVCWE